MKIKSITLSTLCLASFLVISCGNNDKKEDNTNIEYETEGVATEIVTEESLNEEEVVVSTTNSTDWDRYLDSYEEFIDKYIQLLKKSQSGDMSALIEYAEYMEKANDLQSKMEKAKGDLSTSQIKRFMDLQTRLANAASQFN